MKKIFFAIGVITLLIGASNIPMVTSSQPEIVQMAADETMTFRFATVNVALKNVTEFEYTRIFGGKLLKNGLYSNIKISGEYWTEGGTIFSILGLILYDKEWEPKDGALVTIEIGRFIGRFLNGTIPYSNVPWTELSGTNGGFGFDIKATIHNSSIV
jgi:hypothetical protein